MSRTARIAGAGIAGLALATALGSRGWRVIVHERSAELREIGAGITLGPDGIDALSRLGALEETVADARAVEYWSMHDERGRTVQSQRVRRPMFCCHRRSLHRALVNSARAAGAEIRTGSAVVGATGEALLIDAGGSEVTAETADLIVGADGVGSRVRRALGNLGVGVQLTDLNVSGLRYVVERRNDEWLTTQPEWLRDTRRVGILPLGGSDIAVFLSCRRDDSRSRTDPLDHEWWARTFPEVGDVLERAPLQADWRDLVEVHCDRWSFGSTALVGDAGFAMASNLGQGAVSAIRAVLALADDVAEAPDVPRALVGWERRVRPYVEYNQAWSRRYSRIATQWPQPLYPLRSAAYWMLGRSAALNHRFAGV
ncbi:FAD-dependent oxidoreductase [Micromonospora sp. DT44]|uniref:FAD-dependent oxidoreductase n=1 Tax=Micromonospora sp. DT44 TaxID=3393439 RepID=UPI003CF9BC8F